ncbi:hypothetical protein DOTSEDRAFT_22662 [Dothistroma septosporum NZE10]|uniref:BZIP domain-containing protein n=1 Tax=Dothistroma septosporum (strain NZE10 / CBS 128990) TaxID=675120 RepID=N1PUJ9_DOTSN|nr:hypothetical protein DOTSEDRAFT_22662 [Dothistroma septosporum NZE10]
MTKTRKRKSRESNPEDNSGSGDDGKKRGRPRVEKPDASAADRRRTQIRMAQRAYRQRKESTLDEMRKRVSELTNTAELMNKAFVDCRDRLAESGLTETHLLDIREASKQYEILMKGVRNPGEEYDPEVFRRLPHISTGSDQGKESTRPVAEPKNVPSWMDEHVLHPTPRQKGSAEVGMGYTLYMQPADELLPNMPQPFDYFHHFEQPSQALVASTKPSSAGFLNRSQSPCRMVTLPPELNAPRTYSFQESTFGRRLHRACLEKGYQLLLDPSRRPATYDRVFRLSLMSKNRDKLIEAMRGMLDQGAQDSLDAKGPLIHIGGAGTHFPRRDQYGNIQPKKEAWNLGDVGPQTVSLLEHAARDNSTADMNVSIAGFEGEWFDPYDVEGYLREKGIFIDPTASFAEAEVLVWPSIPSETSSGTTLSANSPTTPEVFGSKKEGFLSCAKQQAEYLHSNDAAVDEWMDFTPVGLTDVGYSDASTGSWLNFLQPGEAMKVHGQGSGAIVNSHAGWEGPTTSPYAGNQPNERTSMFPKPPNDFGNHLQQQKKVVIIDVAKFVKVMTASGVCIGQTPGFKRRDVDRALALSTFDAF